MAFQPSLLMPFGDFPLTDVGVIEGQILNYESIRSQVVQSATPETNKDKDYLSKAIVRLAFFSVKEKTNIKIKNGFDLESVQTNLGIKRVGQGAKCANDVVTLYRVLRVFSPEIREYARKHPSNGWSGYKGDCPKELQFVGSWETCNDEREAHQVLDWLAFAVSKGLTGYYLESAKRGLIGKKILH